MVSRYDCLYANDIFHVDVPFKNNPWLYEQWTDEVKMTNVKSEMFMKQNEGSFCWHHDDDILRMDIHDHGINVIMGITVHTLSKNSRLLLKTVKKILH